MIDLDRDVHRVQRPEVELGLDHKLGAHGELGSADLTHVTEANVMPRARDA